MSVEPFGENLRFEKPSTYWIRVAGQINENLTDHLGGIIIAHEQDLITATLWDL